MHITMAEAKTPDEKKAQERLLELISSSNMLIHACKEALLYGVEFPERKVVEELLVRLPDPKNCPVFR